MNFKNIKVKSTKYGDWNGSIEGNELNSCEFVYLTQIEFQDDSIQFLKRMCRLLSKAN